MSRQADERFRLDTYQGQPDITFFRLRASQAEAEARTSPPRRSRLSYRPPGTERGLHQRRATRSAECSRQDLRRVLRGPVEDELRQRRLDGVRLPARLSWDRVARDDPRDSPLTRLRALVRPPLPRSRSRQRPGRSHVPVHQEHGNARPWLRRLLRRPLPGCHDLASSRFWTDGGVSLTLSTTPTSGGEGTVDAAASGTNYENSFPNGYALKCPPSCTGYADTWPTQTVTVEAVPAVGSDFLHWTGACTGRLLECQLTLDHSTSVGAVFKRTAPLGPRRVNVSVTGSGHVTSTPIGLSCPKTCTAAFRPGVTLILRARPATGWRFRSWRRRLRLGAAPSCSLFIYAQGGNRAVQARFEKKNAP